MKSSQFLVLLAALLSASVPALADGTNLLTNGGFETGDFTGYTLLNSNFTAVEAAGFDGLPANGGTYFAALGNFGADTTISQSIADAVGQEYDFSFFLIGDGATPNDFAAYIDGSSVLSLTNVTAMAYTQYSFDFVGTGADTISFTERDDPGYLGLDDVSVTAVAATPEPSSLVLLATGLAGAAGALRRRLRLA